MNEDVKPENLRIHSRADELIDCLEGEIAKRDARIVELQNDASYYAARNEELRAKLAAPVSEAKAQGVVMPEREAFEDAYSAEYGTPVSVLKLLREGENYIEKPQHSDRLNSSWWMWQKARASLNAAHVQQGSVPASRDTLALAYRLITSELKTLANGSAIDRYKAAQSELRAMIDAPEAPAADAGLVEALELAANRLDRLALEQGEFWMGYATAWADESRATANGVKS